ncbi:MAG: hypothetical protein V3T23_03885 [Nitrososphaerales archaeon]
MNKPAYQVWGFNKQKQVWESYPNCFNYPGSWEDAVSYCSQLSRKNQGSKLKLKKIYWWKPKPYDKMKSYLLKEEFYQWITSFAFLADEPDLYE